MPVVTVAPNPNGFPIAITPSPILNLSEFPILTLFKDVLLFIFKSAKSVLGSVPTTSASYLSSFSSTTDMSFAFSIT